MFWFDRSVFAVRRQRYERGGLAKAPNREP